MVKHCDRRRTVSFSKSTVLKKNSISDTNTTCKPRPLSRNPFLNYFRKYYACRRGLISDAAKEAGAKWRKLDKIEKIAYYLEADDAPYIYYSRNKRLNQILKLLRDTQEHIPGRNMKMVRRIINDWKHKAYQKAKKDFEKTSKELAKLRSETANDSLSYLQPVFSMNEFISLCSNAIDEENKKKSKHETLKEDIESTVVLPRKRKEQNNVCTLDKSESSATRRIRFSDNVVHPRKRVNHSKSFTDIKRTSQYISQPKLDEDIVLPRKKKQSEDLIEMDEKECTSASESEINSDTYTVQDNAASKSLNSAGEDFEFSNSETIDLNELTTNKINDRNSNNSDWYSTSFSETSLSSGESCQPRKR